MVAIAAVDDKLDWSASARNTPNRRATMVMPGTVRFGPGWTPHVPDCSLFGLLICSTRRSSAARSWTATTAAWWRHHQRRPGGNSTGPAPSTSRPARMRAGRGGTAAGGARHRHSAAFDAVATKFGKIRMQQLVRWRSRCLARRRKRCSPADRGCPPSRDRLLGVGPTAKTVAASGVEGRSAAS